MIAEAIGREADMIETENIEITEMIIEQKIINHFLRN